MSYGIPSVYIAGEDSELNTYAHKFGAAECFAEKDLNLAKDFILDLSTNKQKWNEMSANAISTAKLFRRDNADKFVDYYLNPLHD